MTRRTTMPPTEPHETHVCRDCGAAITLPYAKADAARSTATPDRDALRAWNAMLEDIIGLWGTGVPDKDDVLDTLAEHRPYVVAALAGSGPEAGLRDDLIERWHVWNSTVDDDLKVMLGLWLMQDAFDALPNLAATPTASPTATGTDE